MIHHKIFPSTQPEVRTDLPLGHDEEAEDLSARPGRAARRTFSMRSVRSTRSLRAKWILIKKNVMNGQPRKWDLLA
eukprot:s1322_g12.t1